MITLYTIHCPRCKILEMKLKQFGIPHEVVDDDDTVVKVGRDHGIVGAPFMDVDGEFLKFEDAVKFVNSKRGN